METEKENSEEKVKKLSTRELIKLAFSEPEDIEEKRRQRWIAIIVLSFVALWWLLFLADTWGWVSLPWLRYFLDPSEEIIRARQGG